MTVCCDYLVGRDPVQVGAREQLPLQHHQVQRVRGGGGRGQGSVHGDGGHGDDDSDSGHQQLILVVKMSILVFPVISHCDKL